MANELLEPCWVLHRRPYRNSSLIVDLLSERQGRVAAVARGGRRNALLQPFQQVLVRLTGRGELRTLASTESAAPAVMLTGQALYCGLYMNEVLMRVLHRDDPHPEVSGLYARTLAALAEAGARLDVTLREFEYQLLDFLGYGFSLETDLEGAALLETQRYAYDAGEGLKPDLRGEFEGEVLVRIGRGIWDDETRTVARQLMRQALAPHLGERPLASRQLFRQKERKQT